MWLQLSSLIFLIFLPVSHIDALRIKILLLDSLLGLQILCSWPPQSLLWDLKKPRKLKLAKGWPTYLEPMLWDLSGFFVFKHVGNFSSGCPTNKANRWVNRLTKGKQVTNGLWCFNRRRQGTDKDFCPDKSLDGLLWMHFLTKPHSWASSTCLPQFEQEPYQVS